ncbi:EVE domain-containing protein [Methanofollis formosanus]|uniref:EVE domain-containing protein n=1 Tax=Methanofollis formosanus TaxID=299308 RepID=A0A8G0ZZY7_9EURY|nr:EVE domain-containing protein [Methanofollis formosanus]QYZ77936.1 EVE domain-containing protein [Methanofollis formosanus]
MTCWIAVSEENKWETIKEKMVWAVAQRHADTISKVELGDRLLVYIHDLEEPSFLGAFEIASELFINRIPLFPGTEEIYPLRVKLKPATAFNEPVRVAPLATELKVLKDMGNWQEELAAQAMRAIPEEDYVRVLAAAAVPVQR